MGRNVTCDLDRFAAGIDKLVGDLPSACHEAMGDAVTKSTRLAAKRLRGELTDGIGKTEWSEAYRSGFTSHVDKSETETVGEVGNKNKPGLVHLLEKGHATLTGRRTQAYPHMEPAFEEMANDFIDRVDKAVGKAIS